MTLHGVEMVKGKPDEISKPGTNWHLLNEPKAERLATLIPAGAGLNRGLYCAVGTERKAD